MLSKYHLQYISQTDQEILQKVREKEEELKAIFHEASVNIQESTAKVAVLGCGDKRFVKAHKELFEIYLKKPVHLTTLDITIEHLQGEENIVEHDCTLPLPNPPYDVTYAHVLLKFIPIEKQWDLILNSFTVLRQSGMAIHVLDREDYETNGSELIGDYSRVPLESYKKKLSENKIQYKTIPIKYGIVLALIKT